jgi:hypothetical protein
MGALIEAAGRFRRPEAEFHRLERVVEVAPDGESGLVHVTFYPPDKGGSLGLYGTGLRLTRADALRLAEVLRSAAKVAGGGL